MPSAYRRSRERALLAGLTTALARGAAGLLCRWKRLAVCSVTLRRCSDYDTQPWALAKAELQKVRFDQYWR